MALSSVTDIVLADENGESVSNANNQEEIKDSIREEVYLLTKAGVIELSEQYDPTTVVTRAEFADYTAAAISANEKMNVTYFSDVPLNHWASDSINALVERKIIDMADDGKFNPDEPITYPQACKMMTAMTGYKAYADMDKIMSEYVLVAKKAGFGINPASNDRITLAEAVRLIYNAMRTDLMSIVSASGESYTAEPQKGENIFSVYHKIKFSDGRVQSVSGKTINGMRAESGETYIAGEKYNIASDVKMDEFFGRYINFSYLDEKDSQNTKTVIYADARYKRDVTKILYDDISGYNEDTRTISYYDGSDKGNIKTKTADSKAVIVFNGQPYDKGIKSEIDRLIDGTRKGDVTFISSGGNSVCDVISVTSYEIFGADAYTPADKKFYSSNKTNTVCIDDYRNCYAFDTSGITVDIKNISVGPFMLACSENKEILTIVVCNKKAEGALSETNPGDRIYTINGTEYKADKAFYEKNKDNLVVGATYKTWLDLYDEIIDYTTVASDGMKVGYITKTALLDNIFDKNIRFKIYTRDDNTLKDFELASKVNIDEVTYKSENYKDIAAAFPGKTEVSNGKIKIERQVIRYKLNKDGHIDKIDTVNVGAAENKDNTLRSITNGTKNLFYTWYARRFGMNVYAGASTTNFMTVPKVNADGDIVVNGNVMEDSVRMYSNKMTPDDWKTYTVEAFKFSSETVSPDLIVVYLEPKESDYNVIMYEDVIMGLDSEGNAVRKLTGKSMGEDTEIQLDDTVDMSALDLKKGDIVRVENDLKGEKVYLVTKMYDARTNLFENNQPWTDPERYWYSGTYSEESAQAWRNQNYQLTRAYAYDEKNGVVASSYTLSMARDGVISEMEDCSKISVTVFDKNSERNPIYKGSTDDIMTYKTAGADCDILILSSTNSTIKQLFVIKQ